MSTVRPDLRRLEHFVAAATSTSLAAAATEVFVTQQALSVSIRRLESELGVELFDRSRRRLQLTAAGIELYNRVLPLLAGADQIVTAVQRAAAHSTEVFTVGHSPAISGDDAYRLVAPVIAAHPDLSVTLRQVFPDQVQPLLLDGKLDIVLRRGVATPDTLASTILTYQPLRLAIHRTHELAGKASLDITDLVRQCIVVWAPEHQSFYTDFLVSHCRRAGFDPSLQVSRIQGAPPATAVLYYPRDCAFVTDPPGSHYGGEVRVLDFSNPPLVPVQALWLPHTASGPRSTLLADAASERGAVTPTRSPADA